MAPVVASPAHDASADGGASLRGYRRAYVVRGENGACQLQRVRVHIRYRVGRELLADYRQTYWEFFQFGADDQRARDVHDFDAERDGWRQQVLWRLIDRHRARRRPDGEPILTVKKQFLIGAGEVRGAAPRPVRGGGAFGFLREAEGAPSRAVLRIARGDGTWRRVTGLPACPPGFPIAGRGRFAADAGHRAFEHFHYRFARQVGTFSDRAAYRPSPILRR